ncbi:hypothetical protein B0A48_10342 [Cryoendolithus antarcticus]|uniref:Protein PBN1 n=1 Tax=Cryoendolithus antarcticus TaxID=1507870 RepID=A0A1V8SWZ5_9PEZI|nr:hypothetical protein B0A48_10342 [Cryoendolithus antarcticus]
MKQRITYLQGEGTDIDVNSLHVNPDSLVFSNAEQAALQKRVTITEVLDNVHELHIRWSSPRNDQLPSPLVSRLPSGLHVFFTPRSAETDVPICELLQTLFGAELQCHSVVDSFSRPQITSERFSAAASYQYFHVLPTLQNFSQWFDSNICRANLKIKLACGIEADAVTRAASLDVDFDAISHAITTTVAWKADSDWVEPLTHPNTARAIVQLNERDSIEIGVLQPAHQPTDEPEELSLGGYLTTLGDEETHEPSATLFAFPSRHHALSQKLAKQKFRAAFQQPTGLHPKLDLTFASARSVAPPANSCALHAYLTLPVSLFIDRYQFSDALSLQSQNLKALHSLSGEDDLEAPAWVLKSWGSAALFEVAHPNTIESASSGPWTITIPTHLRYVKPSANVSASSQENLQIPSPILFWACPAEEGLKFATNPFDRVNLGFDGLFGPKTLFYHVQSADTNGLLDLQVPVLDPTSSRWVSMATSAVVVAGFSWVLWKLFGGNGGARIEKSRKKTQ